MATLEHGDVKQEIITLIDSLPESDLHAVKRYVQYDRDLQDPFLNALANAPWDNEPLTDEDRAAIADAREDIAAGRTISAGELKEELGEN